MVLDIQANKAVNMSASSATFSLPKDGQTYHTEIVDRCTELINYGIWSGLHPSRLRMWMNNNFRTDEEKYFAACILDHLIYRSNEQTIGLIHQLFERVIPDLTRLDPTPLGDLRDCLLDLRASKDPGVRLVTAVKQTDPTTKSGPEISRFMKRYVGVREDWIIKPWEIEDSACQGIKTFVFIDDFLGTGEQFSALLTEEGIDQQKLRDHYFVYAPLAAHEEGVKELALKFPRLRVRSVELLDKSYGVFDPDCRCFSDGVNTSEGAREFYFALLKKKLINISGPDRRGFGHLELTYAFQHATPDNSLPILWWARSPEWTPLFDR